MNSVSASTSSKPLMVVPIPNPHNMVEAEFTLFSVPSSTASTIRNAATGLKSPYKPKNQQPFGSLFSSTSSSFGASYTPEPKLFVQEIGSYKITVAPSLSDLENRAPWESYSIHPDQVGFVLKDVRKRYSKRQFAFIIAEGEIPKFGFSYNAGFGIMYRDSRVQGGFLPTSHEPTLEFQTSNSNDISTASMDVTVIALGAIVKPLSILGNAKHWPLRMRNDADGGFGQSINRFTQRVDELSYTVRGPDYLLDTLASKWQIICQLHNALPRFGDGDLHSDTFVQPEWPSVATVWTLRGVYPNRDLLARKANHTDATVVRMLYSDVDAWIRVRKRYKNTFDSYERLDTALALLARQLAEPGVSDRMSDSSDTVMGCRVECKTVSYLNLDQDDCDLDEQAYKEKDHRHRFLNLSWLKKVDTLGNIYLRISPFEGPFESVEMRTVSSKKSDDNTETKV